MTSADSVSQWVDRLRAGDEAAAQKLWEKYFGRLVSLARSRLQGRARRVADEEDVALSAFDSFCRGVAKGRFPRLANRDDLWRLLVVVTARKAIDLIEHECRQKRGGGAVLGESALAQLDSTAELPAGLEQVVGDEPTPEFAAQVAEECERLLNALNSAELRSVALWKLEGYSNDEIAAKLGCVPRTIERKLRMIRDRWSALES
jgi:DNA-directed RNA polymerase specialized sigma24 family protein